jgi:hypothetical protein
MGIKRKAQLRLRILYELPCLVFEAFNLWTLSGATNRFDHLMGAIFFANYLNTNGS